MLPKGALSREQLSQLLLVYIGTAADIIEFFDAFKDDTVANNRPLCIMILTMWSVSLMQFCLVLTGKRSKKGKMKPPLTNRQMQLKSIRQICCSVDVWVILINIVLQQVPKFYYTEKNHLFKKIHQLIQF